MSTRPEPDPKQSLLSRAERLYRERFGAPPDSVSFAPGRVEVLGNHTDYNGGYVLSVALDLGIACACGRSPTRNRVELYSERLQSAAEFLLDRIERDPACRWADYPKGVIRELLAAGYKPGGLRLAFASDLPTGAGVSSSAALELSACKAARAVYPGPSIDTLEEARLCQRAEAGFVGVPCGLLDQFSSAFGRRNHVLFLDCATLEHDACPTGDAPIRILVADCGIKHELVDGQYASLRQSCERAAAQFGKLLGRPVRFLRDVAVDELERLAARIDAADRPRAEHVIRENARVLEGRQALKRGDLRALGKLMTASHASSRDLFGNSTRELDALVEIALGLPGFIGGKLSGGGFGGATVNFIEDAALKEFSSRLAAAYKERTGIQPALLESQIGSGARVYNLG